MLAFTRFFTLSVLILFFPFVLSAKFDLNQPVPLDPEVRTGVLENGLTYYIRYNSEPTERASFYIVQNVGALLEEDHQNGLAHFLEHMAFNGTENFEGKGVLNTLERHGIAFGRNINAYTSFNETVYNISDVPVTRPGLLDTCLMILVDWSNGLLLTDEEIDLERGVITEEWRTRRNSNVRMRDQWFPVLFKGSQYAIRDVIGDTMVIKYHDPEVLRQFYHDWYRTDLQAIVVVGDFDVDEMEQKVQELFSGIPPVEDPLELPFHTIPIHEEARFVVAKDQEATRSQILMYILHENNDLKDKTLEDLREGFIRSLYNTMTSARIQELLQEGTPPFINGYTQISGFVRGYDSYSMGATANTNEQALALETIMVETERIRRYGFAEGELERAKSNYLSNLETSFNQRDKISNDRYARQIQNHYLVNAAVPGIEFIYEFANQVVPGISLEEVSSRANQWITQGNRTLVITGPLEGTDYLTEEEAMGILSKVESMEIAPYEDRITADALIDGELPGSVVTATNYLEEFGAVEWTLSNHVRVVYRHADYQKDNVALQAYSPGGSSIWDDQYVPSLSMVNEFINSYGVGDFDAVSLQRMLAGKRVSVSPVINNFSEGFRGSSAPRNFETMMQLVYLYFEHPRFDEEAHHALMSRYRSAVANMQNEPRKIMSDSINIMLSDYHPRTRTLDTQFLEEVEFDQIEAIYRDRIQDAGDFVFFIVGNIDQDTVKMMAEKYLGSLTPANRTETWLDRGVRFPDEQIEKKIELPLAIPKANINIFFANDLPYTPENNMAMRVLRGILNLRYIETVREDEGGTYGVWVRWSLSRKPIEEGGIQIGFECDPERADYLKSIIYREIDRIIDEGPTDDDFAKTIQNILKDREEARENNSFWMNSIHNYYTTGYDFSNPSNYEDIARELTASDLHGFVQSYFNQVKKLDVTFLPEGE